MLRVPAVIMVFALGAATSAWGQAVQLPTIQAFSVNTTVSVPDGGGALLGSVTRAADSSASRGVPLLGRLGGNRALGSERGHAGMSVHATIIDHAELDQAVLAEAAAKRGGAAVAAGLARSLPSEAAPPLSTAAQTAGVRGLAHIRAQQAAEAGAKQAQASAHFTQGEQAEAAGKAALAKSFYRLVLRDAQGPLVEQARLRLARLSEAAPRSLASGK